MEDLCYIDRALTIIPLSRRRILLTFRSPYRSRGGGVTFFSLSSTRALEYLCVSISKEGRRGGERERWRKKSEVPLRFGQKCKDESRSRVREKAVFGLRVGGGGGGLFMAFLRGRARTRTREEEVGGVEKIECLFTSLANEISRMYLLARPGRGACATLIPRTKFSTLRPRPRPRLPLL